MDKLQRVVGVVQAGLPISQNQKRALRLIGQTMVDVADAVAADDDTPGVLTVSEALEILGARVQGK